MRSFAYARSGSSREAKSAAASSVSPSESALGCRHAAYRPKLCSRCRTHATPYCRGQAWFPVCWPASLPEAGPPRQPPLSSHRSAAGLVGPARLASLLGFGGSVLAGTPASSECVWAVCLGPFNYQLFAKLVLVLRSSSSGILPGLRSHPCSRTTTPTLTKSSGSSKPIVHTGPRCQVEGDRLDTSAAVCGSSGNELPANLLLRTTKATENRVDRSTAEARGDRPWRARARRHPCPGLGRGIHAAATSPRTSAVPLGFSLASVLHVRLYSGRGPGVYRL